MGSNYLIKFLEEKEAPTITKKRHTYLTIMDWNNKIHMF